MKLLFGIVNYHTDEALLRLLDSVRVAAQAAGDAFSISLLVVDNSQRDAADEAGFIARLQSKFAATSVDYPRANLGYFGALPRIQARVAEQGAELVVVSNADLTLAPDFFVQLRSRLPSAGAVIAPAILAEGGEGFDQNPKHVQRRSKRDLELLRFLYSSRPTFFGQQLLGHLKERLRSRRKAEGPRATYASGTPIYAAHGALFVFTKAAFFLSLPKFDPFLFGEELFVAEEARRQKEATIYVPEMRVNDTRHASTAALGSDRRRRLMFSSIEFILCNYY